MREEIILRKGRPHCERLKQYLDALPKEKTYRVEVAEYRPKRSDEQNRYLWGVCYKTILEKGGEALAGWRDEDLHEHFLSGFFGVETLEFNGRQYERPLRRSSRLNKQEFSDFVAYIQQKAAELGIYIADSAEYLTP